MDWEPNEKQKKLLEIFSSMTVDCFLGKGTADLETYVINAKTLLDLLEKEEEPL